MIVLPDISIIIPMYNAEEYIMGTIDSVLTQESHDFSYEIIIVNDASTDNSLSIVKKIAQHNLIVLNHDFNKGLSSSRNTGIDFAKGKWLLFLDSDDKIAHDLFTKFQKTIRDGYNCYIFSIINEKHDYLLKQTITEIIDTRAFAYFGLVMNKFILKDICLKFKEGYIHEDICFNVDMMNDNKLKLAIINDAFYIYNCKNSNSITANFNKKEFSRMYNYLFSQIDNSNDTTKKYILEISLGLIFYRPFFMSFKIATIATFRLFKFLPAVLKKGIRNCIIQEKIKYDFK